MLCSAPPPLCSPVTREPVVPGPGSDPCTIARRQRPFPCTSLQHNCQQLANHGLGDIAPGTCDRLRLVSLGAPPAGARHSSVDGAAGACSTQQYRLPTDSAQARVFSFYISNIRKGIFSVNGHT